MEIVDSNGSTSDNVGPEDTLKKMDQAGWNLDVSPSREVKTGYIYLEQILLLLVISTIHSYRIFTARCWDKSDLPRSCCQGKLLKRLDGWTLAKELVRWTFFGSALSCTDTCCDVNSTWQFLRSKGEVGALPRIPGSQNHLHTGTKVTCEYWKYSTSHAENIPSLTISPAFFFSSLIPPDTWSRIPCGGSNPPPSKWLQAWWGDLSSIYEYDLSNPHLLGPNERHLIQTCKVNKRNEIIGCQLLNQRETMLSTSNVSRELLQFAFIP